MNFRMFLRGWAINATNSNARHSSNFRSRIMPKVVTKDGKTRTFAYSKAGMSAAKEYAKQYGGRVSEVNMKTTMLKKKK